VKVRLVKQLYIAAASYFLVSAGVFSVRYVCLNGEAMPEYYGFPFVKSSSMSTPIASSMHGNIFPSALVLDMTFWFVVLNVIGAIAGRLLGKTPVKGLRLLQPVLMGFTAIVFVMWMLADWFLLHWSAQPELFSVFDYEGVFDYPCQTTERSFLLPLPAVPLIIVTFVAVLDLEPRPDPSVAT